MNTTHTYKDGHKDETPKERCVVCICKIYGKINMPQTVRENIALAIKDALSGINGQPPFQSEVNTVQDYDIALIDNIVADIALGVFVRGDTTDSTRTRLTHAADCPATIMIGIRGVIRCGVENSDSLKSHVTADIKRALYEDLSLGFMPNNNAVSLGRLSFEGEGSSTYGTGAVSYFLATLIVNFLTDPSNP